jgi:hypothetical protein
MPPQVYWIKLKQTIFTVGDTFPHAPYLFSASLLVRG